MSAPPARRFTYAVLLPDADGARVLLQRDRDGWALPGWETAEARSWADAGYVNRMVAARLGSRVTTLRCLPHDPGPRGDSIRRVYVLENHDPTWAPPSDCRWVDADEIATLPLAVPWHAEALGQPAAPSAEDIPSRRAPWARRGWFTETAAWIGEFLTARGATLTGPVEQERTWSISCILRAPTTVGQVYLKASAAVFAQETGITAYLAGRFPQHIPEVIGADRRRAWLLMRDFGGPRLAQSPDIDRWEAAVRLLAHLQIACADRIDDLFAAGCRDRRPAALAEHLDPLLAYVTSSGRTGRDALSDAELDALARAVPRLRAMCDTLAASDLPATLEHGDFHADNVVLAPGGLVIFDWSDGCVAHPFFALLPFLTFRRLPHGAEGRERIVAAYLDAWTRFGSPGHLQETFAHAEILAALHQAVSYWRILTEVEADARWEWEAELPYFLRLLLARLGSDGATARPP